MAVWTVAGVCAVAAGESAATVSYAAIADSRWFMPAGVIVSAIAAGILGVTMGADPLLVVLVPLMPLGYARRSSTHGRVSCLAAWLQRFRTPVRALNPLVRLDR